MMNIMTKGDLGRKGLIWLACPDYCLSLREVSAGTHTGAERDSGGELLTDLLDLLSVAFPACFFIHQDYLPRAATTHSEPGPPTSHRFVYLFLN